MIDTFKHLKITVSIQFQQLHYSVASLAPKQPNFSILALLTLFGSFWLLLKNSEIKNFLGNYAPTVRIISKSSIFSDIITPGSDSFQSQIIFRQITNHFPEIQPISFSDRQLDGIHGAGVPEYRSVGVKFYGKHGVYVKYGKRRV